MKLVKFSISKKEESYINPAFVTKVAAYGNDKTVIYFHASNTPLVVLHDVEYVVSKLTEVI
jgi:hypothetical protein